MNIEQNDAQNTLLQFVNYYLERRRQTVIEVMIYFRPNLVILYGLEQILNLEKTFETKYHKKIADHLQWLSKHPKHFSGIWKHVWKYQLHGIGCELRHLVTNEYYDWDIQHPMRFSTFELYRYLQWYVNHAKDTTFLTLKEFNIPNTKHGLSDLLQAIKSDAHLQIISDGHWVLQSS